MVMMRGARLLIRLVRQSLCHDVQNCQSSVARLRERSARTEAGNAIELGVELQAVTKSGCRHDLEVHVTEGIFSTEDVCDRDVSRCFHLHRRRSDPWQYRQPRP